MTRNMHLSTDKKEREKKKQKQINCTDEMHYNWNLNGMNGTIETPFEMDCSFKLKKKELGQTVDWKERIVNAITMPRLSFY